MDGRNDGFEIPSFAVYMKDRAKIVIFDPWISFLFGSNRFSSRIKGRSRAKKVQYGCRINSPTKC